MSDTRDATAARPLSTPEAAPQSESKLVQRAPGPEEPDVRDRAGSQLGMIVLLVGGGLFWAGLAALLLFLLR
jgi:hypothetical protein